MTLPEAYTLTIEQGATLKRWFALQYPNGTIVNIIAAGYGQGRLTVRDLYGGAEILNLTTENGGISLAYSTDADGRQWSGFIYCAASSTASLTPWGDGVFDLEISDGFDVIRVLEGRAYLSQEATT